VEIRGRSDEREGTRKETITMATAARSFEELIVWQKAHQFVLAVYRLSARFPARETYGLSTRLRKAAVSVPANIAEGFRRRGRPDKARILNIAEASLDEARYYLLLARDLQYGEDPSLAAQADEVSRMLGAYARSLLTPNS